MPCVLTGGIPIGCGGSTGGLKNVYVGAFSDTTAFTYDADDIIDTMTSTESYYTFKFKPQSGSQNEEGTHSIENGTTFYTQVLALTFHKLQAASRNKLLELATVSMHVIVETQNGEYWLLGLKNGADLTASTSTTGQAYGDLNGYTVTITGLEPVMAHQLSQTAFDTLTIAV
tara:strand:+ start:422 stop:937 length:516 start_codon:yes stop_codon:yes gene_type:complete